MYRLKLKNKLHKLCLLLFMLSIGVVGSLLIGLSFATPPNPEGYADYCYLEANNTVIYGWAHDVDAPAGDAPSVNIRLSTGQSTTVATSIAGYRDAAINQDLTSRGSKTSSVYGFRAVFSGVYKGSAPTISGTILNYGPGSDTSLGINDFRLVDGNPYNFPGKKVPDACLGTMPVPQSQAITPVLPPNLIPPRVSPSTAKAVAPIIAPVSPMSSDANAIVTPRTFTANVVAPTGNAAIVNIIYGIKDGSLTNTSSDASIEAGNAIVKVKDLQPKTQYFYHIQRFNTDKSVTSNSPTATFTTLGFNLALTFTDKSSLLTATEISINQLQYKGNTDDKGEISIKDIPAGTYSVVFTYHGAEYTKEITVSTNSSELVSNDEAAATTYKAIIDVAELTPNSTKTSSEQEKKSSKLQFLLIPLTLFALGGGIYWYMRRRSNKSDDSIDTPYVPLTDHIYPPQPSQTNDYHIGESIKDMVLKSMHQEALDKAKEAKDKEA